MRLFYRQISLQSLEHVLTFDTLYMKTDRIISRYLKRILSEVELISDMLKHSIYIQIKFQQINQISWIFRNYIFTVSTL